MKVYVEIADCQRCRHFDHSGAFTPGGAEQICGHPDVVEMIQKHKPHLRYDDPNKPVMEPEKQVYHWKNRTVGAKIPEWCPLKNGKGY